MELKELLDAQAKAFEDFKAANDKRLKEVETRGAAHEATVAKVETINAELTRIMDAVKAAEKELQRIALYGAGNEGEKSKATPEEKAYRSAFFGPGGFMRKGVLTFDGGDLAELAAKAMYSGSDPDGGYWVPTAVSNRVVERLFETSPMRQICALETIGTADLEGDTDLNDATTEGWTSERGTRNEDTATPQVGKWKIEVHEQYAEPQITQRQLDDATRDVEGWLARKLISKFSRVENTAFLTGNGVGKPRGLLTYTTAATADSSRAWGIFEHVGTGSNGSFGTAPNGSDKLIDLVHKLKAVYRANARFLMSRATVAEVRKLKDADNNYIWLPSMMAAQPATLLGYPVEEGEDMPAASTTGALAIAFGDFRETYTIVDRQGIQVLRDPYTKKGFVKFYTTKRVGGDVVNFDTMKFLKMS